MSDYGCGRLLEWEHAILLTLCGLVLLAPAETLSVSVYAGAWWPLPEVALGAVLVAIGLARVVCLWLNGHWRPSPLGRLAGSVAGAAFFGYLAAIWATSVSPWTWATVLTGSIAAAEIAAGWRVVGDLRLRRRG